MRIPMMVLVGVLTLGALPLAALSEEAPGSVLTLNLNERDTADVTAIAERVAIAAQINADRLGFWYILRVGQDRRAESILRTTPGAKNDDASIFEDLLSFKISPSSPNFSLAQEAYEEVMAAGESLELPQTPAIKKLVNQVFGPARGIIAGVVRPR